MSEEKKMETKSGESLEQRINSEIKASMLAKETVRLEALRAVKAAILLAKTSGASHELTDTDVVKLMQKLVKQRKESAELYTQAGRAELAEKELAESAYIEAFLPKRLEAGELEAKLREIIARVGAHTPADMGKVMGTATRELAGLADGKEISEIVKRVLAGTM